MEKPSYRSCKKAFTLMEIVISLGVFAFAITIILGLFAQNLARVREVENLMIAQDLVGAVDVELKKMGWSAALNASGGAGVFDIVYPNGTLVLVANQEANLVDVIDGSIPANEQYFRIEVVANHEDAYRFGSQSGLRQMLALEVTVSWPYRTPGGESAQAYVESRVTDRDFHTYMTTIRP